MKNTAKIAPVMLLALVASVGCSKNNDKEPEADPSRALANAIAEFEDGEVEQEKITPLLKKGVLDVGDPDTTHSYHYYRDNSTIAYYYTDSYTEEERQQYVRDLTESDEYFAFDNDVVLTRTNYVNYPYDGSQLCTTEVDEETGKEYYTCDGTALIPVRYKDTTTIWKDDDKMNYVYERNDETNAYSFAASVDYNENRFGKAKTSGGVGADVIDCYDSLEAVIPQYKTSWSTKYPTYEEFKATKQGKELVIEYYISFFTYESLISCEYIAKEYSWQGGYAAYAGLYMEQGRTLGYEITITDNNVTSADFTYNGTYRVVYKDLNWKQGDPTPTSRYVSDEDLAKMNLVVSDTYGDGANTFTDRHSFISLDEYEVYQSTVKSVGNYGGSFPDSSLYREFNVFDDVGSNYIDIKTFTED